MRLSYLSSHYRWHTDLNIEIGMLAYCFKV